MACPVKRPNKFGCCFWRGLKAAASEDDCESDQDGNLPQGLSDDLSTSTSSMINAKTSEADSYQATLATTCDTGTDYALSVDNSMSEVNEIRTDLKLPCSEAMTLFGDWSAGASLLNWPNLQLQLGSSFVTARLIKRELGDDPATVFRIYEELQIASGTGPYVAVWLGFGAAWLLCLCKHEDPKALQQCFAAGDALSNRLKFVVRPVKVPLPVPAKSPKDAEYVGPYFGDGAYVDEPQLVGDVLVHSVRVDLYSNWVVKMALQLIGFQTGNCIELQVIDWPQRAVLAGFRLTITTVFKEQLGRCIA